jgi:cytochrome bd ubiquinol oxidase subunit II
MDLQLFWFLLIAVLWVGYFVLEGFDFGVGMSLPFLGRNTADRHAMLETIGPVWDGNEVWLVVAGGATFAAFPAWYATMFSGFYIALLLVLVLLIVRVVSFEWGSKSDHPRWRAAWFAANAVGSFGAPFVWGVALAALLYGVPLNSDGDFVGSFADLFNPYTVVAGLAMVLIFAFHGTLYLTLRTTGELLGRAQRAARTLAIPAAVAGAVLVIWTVAVGVGQNDKDVFPPVLPALLGIAAFAAAAVLIFGGRSAPAFAATALGIVTVVATIFMSLYPRVMVSAPDFGNSLTIDSASSSHYALGVMTVVALILVPVILLYQGWTYYVFRARLSGEEVESPVELVERATDA